jgi:subtilisin-like proprotein convertase family protein
MYFSKSRTRPGDWGTRLLVILTASIEIILCPHVTNGEPLGPSSRRTDLVFSEIMYYPAGNPDAEYIEIYNSGINTADLSGYQIEGSVNFTFSPGTKVGPKQFLIVNKQASAGNAVGPYVGSLPNDVGTIRLVNRIGAVLLEVTYEDKQPWPASPAGTGHSLVLDKPSYGEADPAAWAASQLIGGSPGTAEPTAVNPYGTIILNELLAAPSAGGHAFVEFFNSWPFSISLQDCYLSDDPALLQKTPLAPGTSMNGFSYASFGIHFPQLFHSSGGTLFLSYLPAAGTGKRVISAIKYSAQRTGISVGAFPKGSRTLRTLAFPTESAENTGLVAPTIVINEIMYNPARGGSDAQYIELYNASDSTVTLQNWQIGGDITFTFSEPIDFASHTYLTVAKNKMELISNYPGQDIHAYGNFSGKLPHGGGVIRVLDPAGVSINEVRYKDGGQWGEWSDGGGSSLELSDPLSDNTLGANWKDSDESNKTAEWLDLTATGFIFDHFLDPPLEDESHTQHVELLMLGKGDCYIDDVRVVLNGGNTVDNSDFSNSSSWEFQGNHKKSEYLTFGGTDNSASLRLSAEGGGDQGANRVRGSLTLNQPLANQQLVTIGAKARWRRGSPDLVLRLEGNGIEVAGTLKIPKNLGTPGAQNTAFIQTSPPAIYDVSHTPVLPAYGQNVTISVKVHSRKGISSVKLYQKGIFGGDFSVTPVEMTRSGNQAEGAIYTAVISGSTFTGPIVGFYVTATDTSNLTSTYPDGAPGVHSTPSTPPIDRLCLIQYGEVYDDNGFQNYRIWVSPNNEAAWADAANKYDNTSLDVTFVYGQDRIVYNAGGRYAGSLNTTYYYNGPAGTSYCGYKVELPGDNLLLGAKELRLDFPPRHTLPGTEANTKDFTLQREQLSGWIAEQMDLPYMHRRYVNLFVNGFRRYVLYEDVQQPDGPWLHEFYPSDNDGALHKMEFFYPISTYPVSGSPINSAPRQASLAKWERPRLDGGIGNQLNQADYRWLWGKQGADPNDYSELFKLIRAFDPGSSTFLYPLLQTISPNGTPSLVSSINVDGPQGSTITKLRVQLLGLTHTRPKDLDILLEGPDGTKVLLLSDCGGTDNVNDRDLIFDQEADAQLNTSAITSSGPYRPSDVIAGLDTFPGVVGTWFFNLEKFNTTDPNGQWTLHLVDDQDGKGGSLQGWALDITTTASTLSDVSSLEEIADMQQWIRMFAFMHIVNNTDAYTDGAGHNMFAYKPERGRWTLIPYDMDVTLGARSGSTGTDSDERSAELFHGTTASPGLPYGLGSPFTEIDETIAKVIKFPKYWRPYLKTLNDVANGPSAAFAKILTSSSSVVDERYTALNALNSQPMTVDGRSFTVLDPYTSTFDDEGTDPSTTAIKTWLANRKTAINSWLGVSRTVSFSVTPPPQQVSSDVLEITGFGNLGIDNIYVSEGGVLKNPEVTWEFDNTQPVQNWHPIKWRLRHLLHSGANNLKIVAYNHDGSPTEVVIPVVQYTPPGTPAALGKVFITEWMAEPNSGDDYFLLYNASSEAVDLLGCTISKSLYSPFSSRWTFPASSQSPAATIIQPHSFLTIWNDSKILPTDFYGPGIGQFHTKFKLSKYGDSIYLFSPGEGGLIIDFAIFGLQQQGLAETVPRWIPATGLAAVVDHSDIHLSWNSVPDAISYILKRAPGPNGPFTSINVSAQTYQDAGLQPGVDYYYKISAINQYGEGPESGTILVTTDACSTARPSLAGWWKAENDGSDSAGSNPAQLNSISFTAGKSGSAFAFDGQGFIKVLTSSATDIGRGDGFTFEAWVNPATISSESITSRQPLCEYGTFNDDTGGTVGVHFWGCVSQDGDFYANIKDINGGDHFFSTPGNLLSANIWQHVALTYARTSGDVIIYVNGNAVHTEHVGSFTPDTKHELYFGARMGGQERFKGAMDEIALYKMPLTQPEIQSIFLARSAGKCPVPPPSATPSPSGLVSLWKGEGNSKDSVGSNDGQPTGMTYVPGKAGSCFSFDAGQAAIRVAPSATLDVGQGSGMTFEAWIKPMTFSSSQPIFEWGDESENTRGVQLWSCVAGTGNLYVNLVDVNGQSHTGFTADGQLLLNEFQHIALTYDKTTGMMRIYRNGAKILEQNLGIFTPRTSAELHIGDLQGHFTGMMDEIALYNRSLPPEEIEAVFLAGSAGRLNPPAPSCLPLPSGLAAIWKGEGAAESVNCVRVQTGGLSAGSAKVGTGFVFDGANSYLQAGPAASLNIGIADGLSVETWISPTRTDTYLPIVEWGKLWSGTIGLQLWVIPDGKLYANVPDTEGNDHIISTAANVVQANQFAHVALTYYKNTVLNSGIVRIYVNGIPLALNEGSSSLEIGAITPKTTDVLNIGARCLSGLSFAERFDGIIDEVSLYSTALTTEEIQNIFRVGSVGKCTVDIPPCQNSCPAAPCQISGIQAWWRAEGDYRDSINCLEVQSENVSFAGGAVGNGFGFDGSVSYVQANPDPSLDIGSASGFTIEGWVAPAVEDAYLPITEWGDLGWQWTIGVQFWIFPGGALYANLLDTVGTDHQIISDGGLFPVNQFTHLALTYAKDEAQNTGLVRIYVNGVSVNLNGAGAEVDIGAVTPKTTAELNIGARCLDLDGPYFGERFNGILDEISLYNRALSGAEVQAIYNAGSSGKCPP